MLKPEFKIGDITMTRQADDVSVDLVQDSDDLEYIVDFTVPRLHVESVAAVEFTPTKAEWQVEVEENETNVLNHLLEYRS